jgi:hypothetical protein
MDSWVIGRRHWFPIWRTDETRSDAHKQVKRHQRNLVVDHQGFLLKVILSAADTQDCDGDG